MIESTFTTETGSVKLIDAMAFADGQRDSVLEITEGGTFSSAGPGSAGAGCGCH